jgi:ribosomal protein S18 acetylase RimI-like enzyme
LNRILRPEKRPLTLSSNFNCRSITRRTLSAKGRTNYPRTVIRPARKNDATSLGTFFMRAWQEAGPGALGFTGATDEAIKAISSEEFLLRRLKSSSIRIVVAERGEEILGFASVRAIGKGDAELSGIVVLEGASGMGLGTKLIGKACETAVKLGSERLIVRTEVFNQRAIRFYKENRFTESTKTSQKVGRVDVPLLVLQRKLR